MVVSHRSLQAQAAPRPWLDWRTVETEHFVLHYPSNYRVWALALAERIEGVREQVQRIVGFAPERRVDVVIDDPANDANGYAFTPLDAPTMVLWPTPPVPRSETGNYGVWEELLATHELAHVAHLTRPSRNGFQKLLWSLSPVPLGPIAVKAPRWVLEGYATFVEGRATGSGRPNNSWRPALLRQFAIEGRMPTYGQLSATGGWQTGSFAYLVGSAYLEWLAQREGDSSVTALWRRMTAKTNRSFDQAFAGVYGLGPADLYGRFAAEVTTSAVELERALRQKGMAEGALVQRLTRTTGDPALSPDGRFVALTIRRTDAPSQLVVWKTAEEPDTAAAQRRERARKRDPEDVPDRAFFPPPKKPVATLVADDGAPYETPRWFSDNKRLLVTRSTPLGDGTLRPDLYVWSAEDGDLRRVTRGAALRDADPSSDGRWAAAVRCDQGWCDLVRVDLETGSVRVMRAGSVERNYYRPRVSRLTGEIVVAEQFGSRWRVARVSPETGALHYADPDDGVTRYDATYAPDGRTLVVTSEATGIANLERLDPLVNTATPLTAVTGAAVSSDVAPDGAVWFLSLQGTGYDLRRIRPDSARPGELDASTIAKAERDLILPPRRASAHAGSAVRPARGPMPTERAYGIGPSRFRYFPAASAGFGGSTLALGIVRSDPVGRVGVELLGVAGSRALPAGGAITLTSRVRRTALTASGWTSHEAPSREAAGALPLGLDLSRSGGALRLQRAQVSDGSVTTGELSLLAEHQRPTSLTSATRTSAVFAFTRAMRQRDDEIRYEERLSGIGEVGHTEGGVYARQRAALEVGTGTGSRPLSTARFAYGTVGGGGGSAREVFVVGGFASPLLDPVLDARRVDAPAYPVGSASGTTFIAYRAALPVSPVELFYDGVNMQMFRRPLRSYGAELRERVPAIAALGTPNVEALAGVARAVDEPVKGKWRFYLSVRATP